MMDLQQDAVYLWERQYIAPLDKTPILFNNIKPIVDYIWTQEDLSYPPLVKKIPKNNKALGLGSRTVLQFKETSYTWIILHEISHCMTSLCDGNSNYHGAIFMGVYCKLLEKYLNLKDVAKLAINYGLVVKLNAKPVFS